jgi:uncharacterized protein YqeY
MTSLRESFPEALKAAMRAGDKRRVSTLRLIQAAIKDRDIEARGAGKGEATEEDILAILQKMIKQRQESLAIYEQNSRPDLADQEREEAQIIAGFLPQPLDAAQVEAAIRAAVAEAGATSMKDMGKVVAILKAKHPGRMDFGKVSAQIKAVLGS